jgi:SAM-dependent methyltransferase
MQAWFARTGDGAEAPDPYFLYAASNVGSLAALLAYPLLVEPTLRLGAQSWLWTGLYAALILLVAACGWRVRGAAAERPAGAATPAPRWGQRLRWTILAAVPSGLLLSTTTHLTTDIMAMPLLWVVPLALYLVTFILAFSPQGGWIVDHAQKFAPIMLLMLGSYTFLASGALAMVMAVTGLVLFWYVALALHGALARSRPAPDRLTDFYVWVSVGGMLGGIFCALVAPAVFDWSYEHPLLLVAAAALLPAKPILARIGRLWDRRPTRYLMRFVLPVLTILASLWLGERMWSAPNLPAPMAAVMAGIGLAAVFAIGHRKAFAVHFAAVLLALGGWASLDVSTIPGARERSFFGIYSVQSRGSTAMRELLHGTTLHGAQSLIPGYANMPMTYYAPDSGLGRILANTPTTASVGVVGLGTGTTLCYARPGQRWTVFEIDPAMVGIARDSGAFTYMRLCKPDAVIDLGDARLRLGDHPRAFDRLAIDAFSSDAIPLHLMTAQAFDAYDRALKPGGVLLVHISNRHLDLEPVVAAIAAQRGWAAQARDYAPPDKQPRGIMYTKSVWIALSKRPAALQAAIDSGSRREDWRPLRQEGLEPWSDDFASVLPVIKY